MSRVPQDTSYPSLQQVAAVQPKRRKSRILFSVLVAALGGFLGGVLTSYGPTYLHVHLTQPVLTADHVAPVDVGIDQLEKLLADEVAETVPTSPPSADDARLVIHAHDRSYLLLESQGLPSLGKGKIERVRAEDGFITTLRQQVRESKVPAASQGYLDRKFVLHDAQGFVCTARAAQLMLVQQIATDFDETDGKPQRWDEYGGSPMLVAELIPTGGNCKDAVWARDAALPPPALARISDAHGALRRKARAAFRATKLYKKYQADFEFQQGTGLWDADTFASTSFTRIRSAAEELVLVSIQVGGCGEFEAQVGVVFRVDQAGTLEAVELHKSLVLQVDAAADIDGDGDLELMTTGDGFDRSLLRQQDEFTEEAHSAVSIQYCRC